MELSEKLKQLRLDHDLTQLDVALKLEIGYSTYRNFEAGTVVPKAKEPIGLAQLYNVTVDMLLGLDAGKDEIMKYNQEDIKLLQAVINSDLPPELMEDSLDKALRPLLDARSDSGNIDSIEDRLVINAMRSLTEIRQELRYRIVSLEYTFPDGRSRMIVFNYDKNVCDEGPNTLTLEEWDQIHSDQTYKDVCENFKAYYDFHNGTALHGSEEQKKIVDSYRKSLDAVCDLHGYKRIVLN